MKFNAEKIIYEGANIFSTPCTIAFVASWRASNGEQMIIFSIETEICNTNFSIPLSKLTSSKELNTRLLNLTSISIIAKTKDWGAFSSWVQYNSFNFLKKYPMFRIASRNYRVLKDFIDQNTTIPKNTLIWADANSNGDFQDTYRFDDKKKKCDDGVFSFSCAEYNTQKRSIFISDIGTYFEPLTEDELKKLYE